MTLTRTSLVACVAAAALAAPAAGGGAENIVLSRATVDDANVAHSRVQIAEDAGPAATSGNLAAATATGCVGCHATAVAVQLVLTTGDPRVVAPENVATAVDAGCMSCGTFAYAWQYVLPLAAPAHLSAEGELALHRLEREIDDVAASAAPDSLEEDIALAARLDALTAEVKDVVQREVRIGGLAPAAQATIRSHADFDPR